MRVQNDFWEAAGSAAEAGFKGISTYDLSEGGHTHVDVRHLEWNGHNGSTIQDERPDWRINGKRAAARRK